MQLFLQEFSTFQFSRASVSFFLVVVYSVSYFVDFMRFLIYYWAVESLNKADRYLH